MKFRSCQYLYVVMSLTTLKIWSFLTSSRRDLTECSWCAEEDGKSLPFTHDMNHLEKKLRNQFYFLGSVKKQKKSVLLKFMVKKLGYTCVSYISRKRKFSFIFISVGCVPWFSSIYYCWVSSILLFIWSE